MWPCVSQSTVESTALIRAWYFTIQLATILHSVPRWRARWGDGPSEYSGNAKIGPSPEQSIGHLKQNLWPPPYVNNWQRRKVHWTAETESAMLEAGNEGVHRYYEQLISQLNDMVYLIRGKLSKMARVTIGALAVIDVHARDVMKKVKTSCGWSCWATLCCRVISHV